MYKLQNYHQLYFSSDTQGKLVYANYGRVEDFKYLEDNGINVTDKVVIVRYGKLFRGGKVKSESLQSLLLLL